MELFANEMLERSAVDGRLFTIEWTYSFIWSSVGMKLKKRRVGGWGSARCWAKRKRAFQGSPQVEIASVALCTRSRRGVQGGLGGTKGGEGAGARPSKAGHRTPATNASGNPPSKMVPCTDLLLFRVQVRYIPGF